jgi:hypothetical protein
MEDTDDTRKKEGEPEKNNKRASAAALIGAFADEYRTDREHYNRREHHRVVREWLTIIFLFVAASAGIVQACIFIGQLHEMEKVYGPIQTSADAAKTAADAALKQAGIMQGQLDMMERDQQPYVSITDNIDPPTFSAIAGMNGQIRWSFRFTNSGKGTARDLTIGNFMSLGTGPFKRSFGAEGRPIQLDELAAGRTSYFTTASLPVFSQGQFDSLKMVDGGISVFIEFKYFDYLGKSHETAVCPALLASGAIARADPANCKKQKEQ